MSLDSQHLAQFVAIVETGSYRKAAEKLFIAQPALTVSIRKLERDLGVPVFVRSHQGVTLTAAGEALLEYARRALSLIEAGRSAAIAASAGLTGTLRLGFVGSATYSFLPRALPAFKAAYPGIRIELYEGGTAALLEKLRHGAIDACVVRQPVEADAEFSVRCVESDVLMAVVPESHELARRASIHLSQLKDEPFIGFSSGAMPFLSALVTQACAASGFTPHIGQMTERVQTVVSLVASGMGVALVPSVASTFSNAKVRFIPLHTAPSVIELRLSLVHLNAELPPAVRHFLALLDELENVGQ